MASENNLILPKVLVLLAAYNGSRWLDQQVKTILFQQDVEITLFISVDLSTDDTYEKCQKLAAQNENIHVLSYGERFGGAAPNFFRLIGDADFNDSAYVAFADQDDIWFENKLSYSITQINQRNLDGFSSNVIAFWPDGKERLLIKSYTQKRYDYLFEAAGPGCTYVLKSEVLKEFQKLLVEDSEAMNKLDLHDWTLYAFVRSQGLKWHIDSRPLLWYRQHSANQIGINSGWQAFLSRFIKIKDKWYYNQVNQLYYLFGNNIKNEITLKRKYLIRNYSELRRRPRDAYFLLLLVVLGIFK